MIQVTIELKDNIDLENVELKAISRARISAAEKASLEKSQMLSLTDAENEAVQLAALKVRDKISEERYALLEEHYDAKNEAFISSTCLKNAKIGSVGIFTPFIRDTMLTKNEILEIAKNPEVCRIDLVQDDYYDYPEYYDDDDDDYWDFQNVNDTYRIVGGDAFINAGYTGSGIRVGVVEKYHPITSVMGNDKNNIVKVNDSETEHSHATMVCGIIKKFAPSCSIYTYALEGTQDEKVALEVIHYMIQNQKVHVINLSYGRVGVGTYNALARELDYTIRNTNVPIVVSAGNSTTNVTEVEIVNQNLTSYGLAANAITVGAVMSNGTDPDAPGAYELWYRSSYQETSPISKPDVCAPGKVKIYSYQDVGTSFAAPHVTGSVVQMMARNSAFAGQPQKLKAALLASATRKSCSFPGNIKNTLMSDFEGAGVFDAEFCYRLSKAGRATHFDVTSTAATKSQPLTHNVYCDYTTKPFRIACTWESAAMDTGAILNISDYDMKVYKNGVEVASSTAFSNSTASKGTNCEIVEIPIDKLQQYGGGYYEVSIYRSGDFYGDGTVRIGLA